MENLLKNNPGRFDETYAPVKVKIDLRDKRILALLSEDARMPLSNIAKAVQLSRDGVSYRINRMIQLGVIKRFFPIINLKKFGYDTYHVFMLLDEMDKTQHQKLIMDMIAHPNTKTVREYSDSWDIELVFIARSVREMDEILMDMTTKYPQLVLEREKLEIVKGYNSVHLPYLYYKNVKKSFEWKDKKPIKKIEMDEKDFQILEILCYNARRSTYEISRKVGLSPDAVSYRIKNMVGANVIRKFTILVDLSKLGFHWYTYAMQVKTFNKQYDVKMKEFVRQHPHIIRAVKTLGAWDFILHILCEDATQYHQTIKELKVTFYDIIKNYESWIAYKEYYYDVFPNIITKKSAED